VLVEKKPGVRVAMAAPGPASWRNGTTGGWQFGRRQPGRENRIPAADPGRVRADERGEFSRFPSGDDSLADGGREPGPLVRRQQPAGPERVEELSGLAAAIPGAWVAAPGRRQAGAPREVYRADVEPLFATADQQVCDVAMPFVIVD
jgi:hypothetical protein